MNENIDLAKILKDCPKGTKLYSTVHGEVTIINVDNELSYPIVVRLSDNTEESFTSEGKLLINYDGECTLVPSRWQRDWSKFPAPWYKKGKFDPKTLQPFDKVLVSVGGEWQCDFFSHMLNGDIFNKRCMGVGDMNVVIPYNNDTKYLVGTYDKAPEFYRYWED